jgi:hypothetical protein
MSLTQVLWGDGPLSIPTRHILAVMASLMVALESVNIELVTGRMSPITDWVSKHHFYEMQRSFA